MKKKKYLCLILAMLTAGTTFPACGNTAETETSSGNNEDQTTATETRRDELPYTNYGGKEFNILCRTEMSYEFDVEQDGDIVNDAVYERNRSVEERFGVDFNYHKVNGGWDDRSIFLNTLTGSVLAGDGAYDMVAGYEAYMTGPATEGYFLNILDMKNIDPDATWWSDKWTDSMTVNDQLYMITGDIAISLWDNIYCMFFNKKLAEEYDIGDIYEIVKNGEWTIDKLYEISGKVSKDVDGDGKFTKDDMYGFASSDDNHARAWGIPCEIKIASRDEDGFMKMTYNSERTQNVLEKLVKLYSAQSTYKHFNEFNSPYMLVDGPNMFKDGRALIASSFLKIASVLRGMDTDFGIIPIPKYDEIQEEYHTTVHDSTTVICFPRTINDPDMSGLIAEALCVYSHYDVIPEYYEISLKTKSSRDTESEAMIDLIRDSLMFNFGEMYSVMLDGALGLLGNTIIAGSSKFASRYASVEKKFEANLEKINEAYGKNQ